MDGRMCPCKCRGNEKARQVARVECMKRRGLCTVKRCGNRKNSPRWECCDRTGGQRGDDSDDGDGDDED